MLLRWSAPLLRCAGSCAGRQKIITIEALGNTAAGKLIQNARRELEVVQCGYCQCGQIMSAAALPAQNPHPSDADIDTAMTGNICRCGTHVRIRAAITLAARNAHGDALASKAE
ncbi:2Fe-2S iron-sulfur cluster-binding protein [Paraburkholderia sp. WS6]|uniref:2Fe-2S iron-sulfur cluster-binding protein n=1 Tax=Paraburkholderia madseniana TaxID=2599607 RepID=A0AAP5B8F6_9BURK|nr:2Fe-2S iron-sulfur cluster-binding protein [Paraburkholderia sp. WS6]MCX4145031.1 2Fe-2S iron-sulfur cluster-binding protein [Paraburkholderia madseniana]MDN7147983.1 2Fe-2S iron-sulfur cluster-binding protein [Paraburkholderia sp. WS6]MDQ6406863.1 2Fe-2S iron-sulfur cluster-binding protein [Paraburkholderia madseniana]